MWGSGSEGRAGSTSPLSLTESVRFTSTPTPSSGVMPQAMKIQQTLAPGEYITARDLAVSEIWWNGPQFLRRPEAEWPICKFDKPSREALKELKSKQKPNNEDPTSFNFIHQCGPFATDTSPDDNKALHELRSVLRRTIPYSSRAWEDSD